MDVSPISLNFYNTPTPVGGFVMPAVAMPEAAASVPGASGGAPETGVILQFSQGAALKNGNYTSEGVSIEDSKRIKMDKARMKEENEPCATCAERTYQDGSDDTGVSFQAPTNIAPGAAASLVRAHEQEHVSREGSKAREKGLNAMSTVTIHTSICPECKKVYVAGGTTVTQLKADPTKVVDAYAKQMGKSLSMLMGA